MLLMAFDYSPRQVAELLQRGEIQLVDVREDHEREAGRIAGSAAHQADGSAHAGR